MPSMSPPVSSRPPHLPSFPVRLGHANIVQIETRSSGPQADMYPRRLASRPRVFPSGLVMDPPRRITLTLCSGTPLASRIFPRLRTSLSCPWSPSRCCCGPATSSPTALCWMFLPATAACPARSPLRTRASSMPPTRSASWRLALRSRAVSCSCSYRTRSNRKGDGRS